jgi:hypothetical protein
MTRLSSAALAALAWAAPLVHPHAGLRPVLVTVDDLPIAAGSLHPDPAERERLTNELLAVLAAHRIPAAGIVTWSNLRSPAETRLTLLVLRPRGGGRWEILQDASL